MRYVEYSMFVYVGVLHIILQIIYTQSLQYFCYALSINFTEQSTFVCVSV